MDGTLGRFVNNRDWDALIILDSFRYDYFEQYYQEIPFLGKGDLYQLWSEGRASPETLINVFGGKYNWDVISGHPWINNKGKEIREDETQEHLGGYYAGDHFRKIDNLWHSHGCPGPVPAGSISRHVDNNSERLKYNTSMIWVMSPHIPYSGPLMTIDPPLGWKYPSGIIEDEEGRVLKGAKRMFRLAYRGACINAMYYASEMVGSLSGKVVIASDHGEQMFYGGDTYDWLGHNVKHDTRHLREVPWLEVDADDVPNIRQMDDRRYVELCYNEVLGRPADEDELNEKISGMQRGELNRPLLLEDMLNSGEHDSTFSLEKHNRSDVDEQLEALGYR